MPGSPSRVRRRAVLGASLLALALPAVPAHAAAPLSLVDKTEDVGPGITLEHSEFLESSGWTDAQILKVDLSNAAVHSDLLTAGPAINDRGPISVAANQAGAVAATNGDFFDIDGAGGPLGAEIKGGTLLKSAELGPHLHAGVGQDGVGRMVDATVQATATIDGAAHTVNALNTPSGSVPANALEAFTPLWGTYSRTRGMEDVPTDQLAEAVVQDGKVVSVRQTGAGDGPIPAGAFTLVGRGTEATALRALQPGDPVTLAYGLKDSVAKQMRFAIGGNTALVVDGKPQPGNDETPQPRTAIGFGDGGKTMYLVTVDGRRPPVAGMALSRLGQLMADLGADTAMNLDGGGSTTMVARPLGESAATVRNTPSDGAERNDPNGVGVFVAPGSGTPDQIAVTPDEPTVFPGLHRTLTAHAVDDHETPVAVAPGDIRWSTDAGSVADGVLTAPDTPGSTATVTAQTGGAATQTKVRVLGDLAQLEASSKRLSLPDPTKPGSLTVTGRDAEGYAAPIALADLKLDYDHSLLRVSADGDALTLTPLKTGGAVMTIGVGGQTLEVPITVGVTTQTVYTFDHPDEVSRWTTNGTVPAEQKLSLDNGHLRLDYTARRNQGITWKDPASYIPLPGQPLRVHINLTSSVAAEYGALYWIDATGATHNLLTSPIAQGAQSVQWTLPPDTKFPIRFTQFQTIQTDPAKQVPGSVTFDSLQVDGAPSVDTPADPPLRADPLVSPDGTLPSGGSNWGFATLSDVQFTAAVPELAKVAIASLKRIRADHPDLVVLNGDVVDSGTTDDIKLARKTLEAGGCDLVAVGKEPPADSTPDPSGSTVPCYYVPGNHESYGAGNVQSDLKPFIAEFGQPYRTFDHKGTRFVLLDSALGTLRGSAFDQLPMLRDALTSAEQDASIHNVVVFAHHPVDDPSETKASQLSDRLEVGLIEKWLTDFRAASGKGVAMVGSHAQVADVHRIEGVPYTVLPSSGKAPYGTPDRGGFTGYLRWEVDPSKRASQQWLTADVRAFAQSISLSAPSAVEVSTSAPIGGSIVQPNGVTQNGTRVVPLAYPMSVHVGGSDDLAIGTDADAARRAGKVAILDPATRVLTGLKTGSVTVSVTNPSMREATDAASLAPITASKTIDVTAFTGSGPRFGATPPVFGTQPAGTISAPQPVTVRNGGDRPLAISDVTLRGDGDFLIAADGCKGASVAPGDTCTVLVRFAPGRAGTTSRGQLEFASNTAERTDAVALTGTGVALPPPGNGDDGTAGGAPGQQPVATGQPGPVAPVTPAGPATPGPGPGAPHTGAPARSGDATRIRLSASCHLVDHRHAVRCTVRSGTHDALRAHVTVGGRSRTVTRHGAVTLTVRVGHRLVHAPKVRVTARTGATTKTLSVTPTAG